jgi:hypothetical protein
MIVASFAIFTLSAAYRDSGPAAAGKRCVPKSINGILLMKQDEMIREIL